MNARVFLSIPRAFFYMISLYYLSHSPKDSHERRQNSCKVNLMHKSSKLVFILLIVGMGVFMFISISYPIIEVNITEINVDSKEQWAEFGRDVRYPVTVEKDWNHSIVSYEVIDDEYYIYWVVPIQEDREVDFHVNIPFASERYVFNETKFILFQWGIGIPSIVTKDKSDLGTLSFVCNSSGREFSNYKEDFNFRGN